jgi:hydroxymethylpyrimidine pyrophosphatase-like HAD family hydrolase
MRKISLVVSDVDGTLVTPGKELTRRWRNRTSAVFDSRSAEAVRFSVSAR